MASFEPGRRYRVDGVIGEGGMGTVYRAHDLELDRPVVMKVPKLELLGAQGEARFFREARVLARLESDRVVRVYEVARGTLPFMVQELLEGEGLDARMARGLLSPEEGRRLAEELAEALSLLHENGIVHRDVKPDNLFLRRDGSLCLLDFGLATSCELTRLTRTGDFVGSLPWLPPEVFRGEEATAASDVYQGGTRGPCRLRRTSSGSIAHGRVERAHPSRRRDDGAVRARSEPARRSACMDPSRLPVGAQGASFHPPGRRCGSDISFFSLASFFPFVPFVLFVLFVLFVHFLVPGRHSVQGPPLPRPEPARPRRALPGFRTRPDRKRERGVGPARRLPRRPSPRRRDHASGRGSRGSRALALHRWGRPGRGGGLHETRRSMVRGLRAEGARLPRDGGPPRGRSSADLPATHRFARSLHRFRCPLRRGLPLPGVELPARRGSAGPRRHG